MAESCPICLEPLENDSTALSCSHRFHTACIVRSLRISSACPMCRDDPHASPEAPEAGEMVEPAYGAYVTRRNRLARSNAEVRRLRAAVHRARDVLGQRRETLRLAEREVERRMARDPAVASARRAHSAAQRNLTRMRKRYRTTTESLIGPAPSLEDMLHIVRLS